MVGANRVTPLHRAEMPALFLALSTLVPVEQRPRWCLYISASVPTQFSLVSICSLVIQCLLFTQYVDHTLLSPAACSGLLLVPLLSGRQAASEWR